ncbi:MAG: hypothetical protein NC818_03940 [Candidatus Omnitrophica bacterium]|nr:hypothetical protein [Candidatus Omnitrophota bacterium]
MLKIIFFLLLLFKSTSSLLAEEWQEELFKKSPRLEYFKKELLKRSSTHRLLTTSPQNVSNPILLREGLVYTLYELEIEKTKFIILKDLSEFLYSLKYKDKEIETIKEIIQSFSRISYLRSEINPQANLWLNQEKELLEEELKKKNEEKSFYHQILKDKFNINTLIEEESLFKNIKTGIEREIIKKKEELLEWDSSYFQERKEKYPNLVYYLNTSTNIPYVFFTFPIPPSILGEIYNLYYERNKIELKIAELENAFIEEKINLQLKYIQKKREILRKIIEEINEAKGLSNSFEEYSSIENIFLEASLSLIRLDKEEELLRKELLIHKTNSSNNELKINLSSLPKLDTLLKYVEENSLFLKKIERDLSILKKMASKHDYFSSLHTWRELCYENEKYNLFNRIFYNWLCLSSAQEAYNFQKEIYNLTTKLYDLSIDSPLYTPFDRKIKRIEILKQELIVLDKEKLISLLWLDLKNAIKVPQIDNLDAYDYDEEILNLDIENFHKKHFSEKAFSKEKKELIKKINNNELALLAKGQGRIILHPKEESTEESFSLPFRLEITAEPLASFSIINTSKLNSLKEYYNLRKQLEEEKENKGRLYNLELLEMTKNRIKFISDLLSEQEAIIRDLEKIISPDIEERITQQRIRILNLKNHLLEKKQNCAFDLIHTKIIQMPVLNKYEEKLILEKIYPFLNKEIASIINAIKDKEQKLESIKSLYTFKNLEKKEEKIEKISSLIEGVIKMFTVKERIGLIPLDDLSELKLIKNNLEEELYQTRRENIALKKKNVPYNKVEPFDAKELQKAYSLFNLEEIKKRDPYLKFVELELNHPSTQETDFLTYLYKERESKIKEEWLIFSKANYLYDKLLNSTKKSEKICEENLNNAIRSLKEGGIGIYGAYGLNSILLKYIEEQKRIYEFREEYQRYQTEIWSIISGLSRFNHLSLIPTGLNISWKRIVNSLRIEPFILREREKRRKEFVSKNYNQKIHAFKFIRAEEEKEESLKRRRDLFKNAQEQELRNIEYLDKLWEKDKQFRERIRKIIEESQIDIKKEINPLKEKLSLREANEEILELIFINYAKRFRKKENIRNYINDITNLFSILPVNTKELENLPQWWAKYISALLPYPEKTHLEEITDPRLLGLYLYYAELKKYLGLKDIESLSLYIDEDKKFLFLDLRNLPLEKIEEYLNWETEKIKTLDTLTLSEYSKQEWEERRKLFLKNTGGIFGYTYGSLKEKNLQKEIIVWLVNSGIEDKEYAQFIDVAETVIKEMGRFLPPLTREEKLNINEAVRLRWLAYKQELSLLEEEDKRLDEAIFIGNLLSWCEFFWENRIKKEEIPLFFNFMNTLKKERFFTEIYGKYEEVSILRKNFYISSLSYWAEKWLNFYQKNPEEAEDMIKKYLSRFRLFYSLDSFQRLYGPLDLAKINPQRWEEKRQLREFMGKIGFFVDWTFNLSLSEEETKTFFNNLFTLFLNKEFIESFYRNQGIELKLSWENSEEKEEILGILINWVQFFHFREIKEKEEMFNALEEIKFIQKKSKSFQLNFDIDEIRYWWEKSKVKGWSSEFLEKIFSNINQLNQLMSVVCNELLKELSTSPFSEWENYQVREKLIKTIEKNKNIPLSRSEIYNLAEKIMPTYNLDFTAIKNYYKEKIYIETAYYVFTGEDIYPPKMFQFYSIMKERGYSLKEMGNFIYLYAMFKSDKLLSKTNPSDLEIYGLLTHLFRQIPPYGKKFRLWMDKATFLVKCFYKEHSKYIDFSLLKFILNYSLLRMRPWQIKLLVENGALSTNSPDEEIRMANTEEDLRRYVFRIFWENLNEPISEEEVKEFTNFRTSKSTEEVKSGFKKAIERYAKFQNGFINIFFQKYSKNKTTLQEIYPKLEEILKETRRIIIPELLRHIFSGEEETFNERQKIILSLNKNTSKHPCHPQPFYDRKKIQKDIIERARTIYKIELPPHKSSSLTWKVLEGLGVEDTLKIYIEDYGWLEDLYKKIFSKGKVDFEDYSILNYFSEEINRGSTRREIIPQLFTISQEIKNGFHEIFNKDIPIQKAIDYAWPILHSGGEAKTVGKIFSLVNTFKKYLEEIMDDYLIHELLFLTGEIYSIEMGEKPLRVYSIEEYTKTLEEMLSHLKIAKEEINYIKLKEVAEKTMFLLQPPVVFLSYARKVEYIHEFINKYHKNVTPKEILVYLDIIKRDTVNFLNLKSIFYECTPEALIIQKLESALSLSFKNFLKQNLKPKKLKISYAPSISQE